MNRFSLAMGTTRGCSKGHWFSLYEGDSTVIHCQLWRPFKCNDLMIGNEHITCFKTCSRWLCQVLECIIVDSEDWHVFHLVGQLLTCWTYVKLDPRPNWESPTKLGSKKSPKKPKQPGCFSVLNSQLLRQLVFSLHMSRQLKRLPATFGPWFF